MPIIPWYLADKGMLFLDEIGDLPLALQSKILRVLQDKRFRPLGSTTEISADFRLVTATHQPLEQMIHEGRFRQDLYYRLQQSCVNVPPLREHKSDIEALSRHFIRQFEQKNNIFNVRLTQQALQRLHRYHYPGNVRELQNIILQACLFVITDKDTLITQTMVESVLKASNLSSFQPANIQESAMGAALAEDIENVSLKEACHRFEARIIRDALDQHQGNRKKAAQQLQMPVRTLSYKCQKYDL